MKIAQVVLNWDDRKDGALKNVGVVNTGGQIAPAGAPGSTGNLTT